MAELTIRGLRDGELRAYLTAVAIAFGEEIVEEEFASNERIFEPERVYVATEGDRIVGGGGSFSFQMTVPGGASLGTAGVTAVGTLPTHRRRGVLRSVMTELLADARRHGDPLALLWASEGSIYQRFGFGMGAILGQFEIAQARAEFRDTSPPIGETRLVDIKEAARVLPPVFDAARAQTPGMIGRSETWWETEILPDPERWRRGAGPRLFVVHEVDGVPEGYLMYRVKSEWEQGASQSVLLVRELMAATSRSERELWRFVFSVDLIQTVQARNLRIDHPLLLMLAEPSRLRLVADDMNWLRIVDVERALGARTYATADRVVIELLDGFLPDQAGRWAVDSTGDAPRIVRTDEEADIALDTTDLASLYLGAFSATQLAAAGRTAEFTPGARARLDAMFATPRQPWGPTHF